MDRNFAFKDAKALINTYNELLKKLSGSNKYINKYELEVKQETDNLLRNNFFQNITKKDLNSQKYTINDYNDIIPLVKALYNYIKSCDLYNYCTKLYNNNFGRIKDNINQLSNGKNIIKWMFSNKENKKKIEEAYDALENEINSDFYKHAVTLLKEFEELTLTTADVILADISINEIKYQDVLFHIYKNYNDYGNKIDLVQEVINQYNKIQDNLNFITANIEEYQPEIKKSIDILIGKEFLKILKGIPVEELNRDKLGIRVKSLSEAGFKNMADIYTCTTNQIASVQGISEYTAKIIKDIAYDYSRKIQKDTKIKLNADNKNNDSNKIILSIYNYKSRFDLVKQKNELLKIYESTINTDIKKIKEILNGVKYYFSKNIDKQNYLNSYRYLKDILYSNEFYKKVEEIYNNYKNLRNTDINKAWEDFSLNSIEYFNIIEEICPGVLGNDDTYYGLPGELAREIQDECFFPDGLLCKLRNYQEWGVKYILHQKNVLLGDEMGLGKTIQAIATMVSLKNTGATHFVVVCPASVLTNWYREITKHSKLRATIIHGKTKESSFNSWLNSGGVAVTTYETTQYFKFYEDYKFELLIVDEAHYIKNPDTMRSKNVRSICQHANRILFMTGTALENKVEEMINLIRLLKPSIASELSNIAFMSSAPQFREKIAPVYYRRKRENVLTELPELIEAKEWCTMGKDEERIYENSLYDSYPKVRKLSWNIEDLNKSCKAKRLKELIDEAESDGRKIIVFSFFLDTIQKISKFLGEKCSIPITGSVTSEKRQEIIDKFDKAPAGSVLLSQILAGGTGLNIQSASVVIICEPQFKPSIENQAISRAYRMGQSRNVLVYRLLCENTVDEKISDLLEEKQKVFNAFADKSVAAEASVEVNEKAFGDIIKEEIERINKKNNYNNLEYKR